MASVSGHGVSAKATLSHGLKNVSICTEQSWKAAPEIGVVWIIDSVYGERRMVMMQDLLPASPIGRGFAVPLSQFQTRHGATGQ